MDLCNETPFPAAMLPGALSDDEMIATVALKWTAQLDGGRLRSVPAGTAWPVFEVPTLVGDFEFPAELHYGRTLVDLFVIGNAHTPGAKPVREMPVVIRSGEFEHMINVVGDRVWSRVGTNLVPTEPAEFRSMPMVNARAFGGAATLDGLPVPYGPNPEGVGFHTSEADAVGQPLPNLERPDDRIRTWQDQPQPACLLIPAASSLGMPVQFDRDAAGQITGPTRLLFQGAVPDLIVARERLGPTLTLSGVAPDGPLVYPLPAPADEPVVTVTVGSRTSRFRLRLSSVVALTETRTLVLTFVRTFRYLFEPLQTPRQAVVTWDKKWEVVGDPNKNTSGSEHFIGATSAAAFRAFPQPEAPAPMVAPPREEIAPPSEYLFLAQPEGIPTLFLAFSRTYTLTNEGRCLAQDESRPLPDDYLPYDDMPEGRIPSYRNTPEGIYKRGTDVVAQGHAQSYGRPVESLETAVQVGRLTKRVLAMGPRQAVVRNGRIGFVGPDPFDRVALRYENAYGGIDRVAQDEVLSQIPELSRSRAGLYLPADLEQYGPFAYARNPSGTGYVIGDDPSRLEGLVLPQLEDPEDRLTPDRLLVSNPFVWLAQPLPAAYDWVHPTWFPRSALFGQSPPFEPEEAAIPEVTRGLMPADLLRPSVLDLPPSRMTEAIHPDASRGASPGLRLNPLRGGEPVRLSHIHPARPDFTFTVPDETPNVRIEVRGARAEARTQRVTLLIEPDEGCLTVVWVAGVSLPRALHPTEMEAVRYEVSWPATRRSRPI